LESNLSEILAVHTQKLSAKNKDLSAKKNAQDEKYFASLEFDFELSSSLLLKYGRLKNIRKIDN